MNQPVPQTDCPDGLFVEIHHGIHEGLQLDLSIRLENEIGVLFGPSGAGKTSLLRSIAGLAKPKSGLVLVKNRPVYDSSRNVDLPLRERGIGMIFQHDLLFPHLTVERNIGFGLRKLPSNSARSRVREIAELCGVAHLLDRWPETLSGGERQRVGLARTLAPRPDLLLCDEPVSAIDHANRRVLIDRIKRIQRVERIPVLYVTHDPAEAISIGQTLFLLEEGKIKAHGSPMVVLSERTSLGSGDWTGLRNSFPASVIQDEKNDHDHATRLRIQQGPTLRVSALDSLAGSEVLVEVLASDIILANQPITSLSAQNIVPGTIERIIQHGSDAEILIRTDGIVWIASVVRNVIDQLDLTLACHVWMIIKARSCRVTPMNGTNGLNESPVDS